MKNFLLFFLILFSFVSCNQKISQKELKNLSGYWEIEKVILEDGTNRDYSINETIDFFEIKNDSGFRKKVAPQFNGKYLVNDVFEKIKIKTDNNGVFIVYNTSYSNWKEEIIELTKEKLVLKNDSNVEYHYKKSIPFSLK
jgi:hypothetical protein